MRIIGWLLLATAVAACGDEPAEDGATRLGVVAREFTWRVAGAPVQGRDTLSRIWELASGETGWEPRADETRNVADGLRLRGRGSVAVVGPRPGDDVDIELLHWLTLAGETRGVAKLHVDWRSPGGEFNGLQRMSFDLDPAGGPADLQIRLSQLRGRERVAGPLEGVESFRLVFEAAPAEEPDAPAGLVDVVLARVGLVSDFDDPEGAGLRHGTFGRDAVLGRGIAARRPAHVVTELRPGPRDRLRLQVALAGRGTTGSVRISDRAGRLDPVEVTCAGGEPWRALEIDLAPADGQPLELVLEAPGESGVVLATAVVQMRPDARPRAPIVVYLEDTLRADRLGAYGYAHPTDPVLRAVAEAGARFETVFAAANWTRPSVSSLLTSLDPATHGNIDLRLRVPTDATTLAQALADDGWLTVSMITNHHAGSGSDLDRGFDLVFEPAAIGLLEDRSTLTSSKLRDPVDAFLREHVGDRVFLYVHSLDPHAPYVPEEADLAAIESSPAPRDRPPSVEERFAQRYDEESLLYDAEIFHNDVEIGRLVETLRAIGWWDDGLFVFLSDHGESFAEHRGWQHRNLLYQEEVRVPWILHQPARIPAGTVVEVPAGHVDVAPTILGLVGAPRPPAWQGLDLSDALTEPGAARVAERTLVVDCLNGNLRRVAIVRWPFKLVATSRSGGPVRAEQLFDLVADPREAADIVDDPRAAERVEAMLEEAQRYVARTRQAAGDAATALDAETQEWMRQMGYLK